MKKIIALQIDQLSQLKYTTDTSIYLAEEFARLGFEIFAYQPSQLKIIDNQITAVGQFIELNSAADPFYSVLRTAELNLNSASLVLIRQDPPFDMQYLQSCQILSLLQIPILNKPQSILAYAEKLIPTLFPQFSPSSIINPSLEDALAFLDRHQTLVYKPLYGYGGVGVSKVTNKEELLSLVSAEGYLLQQYLPEVSQGDKRLYLIDGEPLFIFKRVNKSTSTFLTNLAAGGMAEQCDYEPKDLEILKALSPWLKKNGLFFAGLDILDGKLLEVNITSPTGIKSASRLYNTNYAYGICQKLLALL